MWLTNLTESQRYKLAKFRDEWTDAVSTTARQNREPAEASIADAYASMGQRPPSSVVWVGSPLAGSLVAAALLACADGAPDIRAYWDNAPKHYSDERAEAALRSNASPAVLLEVRGEANPVGAVQRDFALEFAGIRSTFGRNVTRLVYDATREQVERGLRQALRPPTGSISAEIGRQAIAVLDRPDVQQWSDITARFDEQAFPASSGRSGDADDGAWDRSRGRQIANILAGHYTNGQHLGARLGYFAFFASLGHPESAQLQCWFELVRSCGGWWLFPECAILCERISALTLDAEGRAHSDAGAAIAYPDAFGVAAVHGVRIGD